MVASPLNIDPLWCSWFTGFVDGEGYFQIMPRAKGTDLALTIQLREDDRDIIHEIWHTLGCGSVYHINAECERRTRLMASDKWRWRVIKLKEIFQVIIPLFDTFPLRTKKNRDYILWREAALLVGNKAHLFAQGQEKILALHNRMKESHKGPYVLMLEEQLID